MRRISEKKYNHYKNKLHKYKNLNMKFEMLDAEFFIALYENRYLDAIDISNELHNMEKEYYTSFAEILKNYVEGKKVEEKTMQPCEKCLIDLTKEDAELIGGETLKKYVDIENELFMFLQTNTNIYGVVRYHTLRELMDICKPYTSKK